MPQNQIVHVKVQCDNEFRRFVLAEVTYVGLADMIRSLLGFAPETEFKLSYLDDEEDWVLFTSDDELNYAITLSKPPLKVSVKLITPAPVTSPSNVPVEDEAEDPLVDGAEEKPWRRCRGRGGLRGRGGRGGKNSAVFKERIDAKIARLTDRHATLTAKLIESDLPEEKTRGIEWRLSHLQNKIDSLNAKKQQLSDANAVKSEHQTTTTACNEPQSVPLVPLVPCCAVNSEGATPAPAEADVPPFRGKRGCGGRGGRGGGRGGWRREQREKECEDSDDDDEEKPRKERKVGQAIAFACTTPEGKAAFDRLQAAKEAVQAARRDKQGKEVVLSKIEELKEAKAAWREVKMALWKEKRAAAGASCTREAK